MNEFVLAPSNYFNNNIVDTKENVTSLKVAAENVSPDRSEFT